MNNLTAVILFIMFTSCSTNKPLHGFDRQGHRGCRGLMPENTIPAFIKAINLGVTTLELDIVFSADKKAVLSHDPFFNHEITTKPDGSFIEEKEEKSYNIYKMNYDEVRKFDVGMKPHPKFPHQQKMKAYKPLLDEVIDSAEKYAHEKHTSPPYYNIETKTKPATDNIFHPAPKEFVDLLMKVIDDKNIRDRVTIQSFDIRTLQYLHQQFPGVHTSLLIEPKEEVSIDDKIHQLGFAPDIISPEFHMVTASLVKTMQKRNIRVIPWTVNEKNLIDELMKAGVDGIITDYPDLFK
jgi:glycerophosphoryl diester phosphodiesterase